MRYRASHILAEDLELAELEIYARELERMSRKEKDKLSMEFPARKYHVNAK